MVPLRISLTYVRNFMWIGLLCHPSGQNPQIWPYFQLQHSDMALFSGVQTVERGALHNCMHKPSPI